MRMRKNHLSAYGRHTLNFYLYMCSNGIGITIYVINITEEVLNGKLKTCFPILGILCE